MYVIIVGCGKVGSNLAKVLADDNHDVVVIDEDREHFNQLGAGFNGVMFNGVPIDEDVLMQAGIEKADFLAAVTSEDNTNVMVSLIAKEVFKVPRVITRIYDPERELVFQQMGLDTMCPTTLSVMQVKNFLTKESPEAWHSFGNKVVSLKYMPPQKGFIGKPVKAVGFNFDEMVFGIIRDDAFMFARPDMRIDDKDILVIGRYV